MRKYCLEWREVIVKQAYIEAESEEEAENILLTQKEEYEEIDRRDFEDLVIEVEE